MTTSTIAIIALLVVSAVAILYASIKANTVAKMTKIIEQLWEIIDDIDTYSDMCKVDDVAYRQLVENRQKDRWQTGITTDGYGLFIPTIDVRLNPLLPESHEFGEAIAAEEGRAEPTPTEEAVTTSYAAADAEGAAHLLPTQVAESTETPVNPRYVPIMQTSDFVMMCRMMSVDPAIVHFDTQDKVFVKQVDSAYERVDFQFAHPNSVEERIADAEKLVASGEKMEIAPPGLSQITPRRFFSLYLEGHYVLCTPGEATHFCKLTDMTYAYARETL